MDDVHIIFQPTTTAPKPKEGLDLSEIQTSWETPTDWSIPEAYLCVVLSAAFADGELAPEEKQEIASLVTRSRVMKRLSQSELAAVNASVNQRLHSRPKGLEEACKSLPSDMRLSIFAHCVDIVLADGELRQTEADFLNRITTLMGLEEDKVRQILSVIMVKNRY